MKRERNPRRTNRTRKTLFVQSHILYRTAFMAPSTSTAYVALNRFFRCVAAAAVLCLCSAPAQTTEIEIFLIDAVTRMPVASATISVPEIGFLGRSDSSGRFRIHLPLPERFTIAVHHIAYTDIERVFDGTKPSGIPSIIVLHPSMLTGEEIVIRSDRAASAAGDSPFPVGVLLSPQLLQKPAAAPTDLLRTTPGVSLVTDGPWENGISIRGMSRANIVILADNARIETAQDIGGTLSLFNIHDIERIEIVRSSGAALYGTGAFGGIVHIISRQPSFSAVPALSAEVSGEYTGVNNGSTHAVSIDGSAPDIAFRLSGSSRNASLTQTPEGKLPNSQFNDFSVRSSVIARITGTSSVNAVYQKVQATDAGIPGGAPFTETASARYTLAERELISTEYTITGFSPLFSSLAVRGSRQTIKRNVEIIQSPSVRMTPHAIHTTVSGEAAATFTPSPLHRIVFSAEGWKRELISKREKLNAVSSTITGERPIPRSTFFSGGVFAQDEWKALPEVLTISIGARYDWITITNDETFNPEYRILSSGAIDTDLQGEKTLLWKKENYHNTSWSAHTGLRYTLLPELSFSFLLSRAFRSPSLEERFQYLDLGSYVRLGNPDLLPEQCTGYNAGVRFHRGGMTVTADVFLNEFTDLVAEVSGTFESRPAAIKRNIGTARTYGFELSHESILFRWAAVRYAFSYVRGEDLLTHTNLPQIPPLHGNIAVTAYAGNAGSVTVSSAFSAPFNNRGTGEVRTPGFLLFDAQAESRPVHWEHLQFVLRAGVDNILNKSYRHPLSTVRGPVRSGPGRNVFLSATFSLYR